MLRAISELGPQISAEALKDSFPKLVGKELEDLLRRYRRVCVRRGRLYVYELCWPKPARVWAADHTQPPVLVDGCFDRIFAVRDLASANQLEWTAVSGETAQETIARLDVLFRRHGAPLVLKLDNGAGFRSEELREYLESWGVEILPSPPWRPSYNGSCERAIGVLKERTALEALGHGRVDVWDSEDLLVVRLGSNERRAPRAGRQSREDVWQRRRRITEQERSEFRQTVKRMRVEAREAEGYAECEMLEYAERSQIQRTAVRRALSAHGLLHFRRRRVAVPVSWRKKAIFG